MDWFPVATFFLGLVSAVALELAKSRIERNNRREDRREEAERETLYAVQDDMHRLFMAASQQAAIQPDPEHPMYEIGKEVEATREWSASLMKHVERVQDDNARDVIWGFLESVNSLTIADTDAAKIAAYENLKTKQAEAAVAVGAALRRL